MTAPDPGRADAAWDEWRHRSMPTMPNVARRGFMAGWAAGRADYDTLALAAKNTAEDNERYWLAWQSAKRRANELRAALATHAEDVAAAGGVDAIAAVLEDHDWFTPRGYAWPCCTCGAEFPSNDEDEVRAHVAAAIAAALAAPGDEGHDEDGGGA